MEANKTKLDTLFEEQLLFFGKDKALTVLKNEKRVFEKTFNNEDVIHVLKTVCGEFNFSYDELVHSNDKSWQRVSALKFCCYYLYEIKSVKMWIISYVLNRSKTLVYRFSDEIKNTDDKLILKFKTLFDKKINTKP